MRKKKKLLFDKWVPDGYGVENFTEDGRRIILLNPYGKSYKYSQELTDKQKYNNNLTSYYLKNGKPVRLSNTQLAWRSGYLQARKDNAKVFNKRKKK